MNDLKLYYCMILKMDDCVKTQTIRFNKTSLEKQKSINNKTKNTISLSDNKVKDYVGLTDITGLEYKLFLKLWNKP